MECIHIFVAGHARQNNGDAGVGISFYNDPAKEPFFEEAEYIGVKTQNSAVYQGIIKALAKARDWQFKRVIVYSDNRLVVGQLSDNMSARAQSIVRLHEDVKNLGQDFEEYKVNYVSSYNNERARDLAKAAAMASSDMVTAQALQFEVQPGITGLILAFTPKLMIVQFKYKKGSAIKPQKHFHEQASYLLKGSLKYVVADQAIVMVPGASLIVSSNSMHQIEALQDSIEIVTYSPMRADLLKIS